MFRNPRSARSRIGAASTLAVAGLSIAACSPGEGATPGPVVTGEQIGVEGAHEHGVIRMGLAVDGMQISLDLLAPADAVFGFEHAPETEEERAVVTTALDRLRTSTGSVLSLPAELGCQPGDVEILEAPDVEDHGHEHDEEDGHDHDEDEQAADDEEHQHSEVRLAMTWSCSASPEGSQASLNAGALFDDVHDVDLTVITSEGQAGARVEADASFRF